MKWLEEMIDRVNAGGISGEWATQSQVVASSAMDKLEPPAIPDDAVVDLVGCLIDEVERLTRERDALLACRQGEQRCHECPDKLELPAIPDDAVVDLFGCLIDVTQPQCQACKGTGRITISVGGTALLSNVCECVKRDGKQRE